MYRVIIFNEKQLRNINIFSDFSFAVHGQGNGTMCDKEKYETPEMKKSNTIRENIFKKK